MTFTVGVVSLDPNAGSTAAAVGGTATLPTEERLVLGAIRSCISTTNLHAGLTNRVQAYKAVEELRDAGLVTGTHFGPRGDILGATTLRQYTLSQLQMTEQEWVWLDFKYRQPAYQKHENVLEAARDPTTGAIDRATVENIYRSLGRTHVWAIVVRAVGSTNFTNHQEVVAAATDANGVIDEYLVFAIYRSLTAQQLGIIQAESNWQLQQQLLLQGPGVNARDAEILGLP